MTKPSQNNAPNEAWDDIFSTPQLDGQSTSEESIYLDTSNPPIDGEDYVSALPHESLLPTDDDEDQLDSLLLVSRGTVQRLESELSGLEQSLSTLATHPEALTETLNFAQLFEQLDVDPPDPESGLPQLRMKDLLNPFHPHHIPLDLDQVDPDSLPVDLATLSQKGFIAKPR